MTYAGMSRGARLTAHRVVSTVLALHSDRDLRQVVDTAEPLGVGIGGTSARLEVDGIPVFVKRVPLTEMERRPEHVRSTANVFRLPTFCQYGIGGPGFGAWRELAVHIMATNWVLAGDYPGFPLTHHWRVLPESTPWPLPEELADVERAVDYWGGGQEVRGRIEAIRDATASVVLFLEYIPWTLHEWLGDRLSTGDTAAADATLATVERELDAGTAFMNARTGRTTAAPRPCISCVGWSPRCTVAATPTIVTRWYARTRPVGRLPPRSRRLPRRSSPATRRSPRWRRTSIAHSGERAGRLRTRSRRFGGSAGSTSPPLISATETNAAAGGEALPLVTPHEAMLSRKCCDLSLVDSAIRYRCRPCSALAWRS